MKFSFFKNWKHYVFEFFMLFVAISLGFFVENKREYYGEREQEEAYMMSLVEDLKSDTALLNSNIRLRNSRIAMIDSLVLLLRDQKSNEHGQDIYYYARIVSIPSNAFLNDRTIQQLKSSGSLRLIQRPAISSSIMRYYQTIQTQYNDLEEERGIRLEYRILVRKVLDGYVLVDMTQNDSIKKPIGTPALVTSDRAIINEFIVQLNYIKKSHQLMNGWSKGIREQGVQLIADIEAAYKL